jgi:hypothetical protein
LAVAFAQASLLRFQDVISSFFARGFSARTIEKCLYSSAPAAVLVEHSDASTSCRDVAAQLYDVSADIDDVAAQLYDVSADSDDSFVRHCNSW